MHTFEVWAPRAGNVRVKLADRLHSLERDEDDWWRLKIEQARPGDDYAFVLNESSTALPDPRSAFQPFGVHGPSRIVDHNAFRWTDQGWQAPPLSSAAVYELHIGTFTSEGTFESAIERLAHLVDLGVTHVEIMPVSEFPGDRGWGYDGVDLYAPHHAYGGPEGLKRLVDACHANGLAVLLDVVYNHLGPVGNYLGRFGPYFTDTYETPWGSAVNLDGPGSREVRRFFCDNARMWLRDYHFDGLRIDAIHAFFDRSAIHFLEQLAMEIDGLESHLGRQLVLIAESDLNQPAVVRPREAFGFGIDAQWSDDFHHALHTVLTGERTGYYADFGSLANLAKAMKSVFVYDGVYSEFRKRIHGRPVVNLSATRFLGYLQNHDQIGNRARGDRSSHLMSIGRLKIAAALVLLSPIVPMLFQGEEFAASAPFQYFTGYEDPQMGHAVSEGRKNEFAAFGWNPEDVPDPQAPETFQRSKLNWQEAGEPPHDALLDWHKRLIALRRSNSDLTSGSLEDTGVDFDEKRGFLALRRGAFIVISNFAKTRLVAPIEERDEIVLASDQGITRESASVFIPPESAIILQRR
ncbi:MAG TPA: malto-oligosyltrehalose trehalohydrolase [Bryobacteraceae bacterium]|nr:malto-oligosyltrehalose trehalohydrolase [Bryobacteraceae bacterium]